MALLSYALFSTAPVQASPLAQKLPYIQRSRPYCGYTTAVRGDIRTVGMAGATVGLGDTFFASTENPAGLAMTVKTGDTHVTSNDIEDPYLQNAAYPIHLSSAGAALNLYPWGFSIGSLTPYREGQPYWQASDPATSAVAARNYDLTLHEYRASVARVFWDDRLSVGLSFNLGIARETYSQPGMEISQSSTRAGFTWGSTYQFPKRLLLGASYASAAYYKFEPDARTTPQGFFQEMDVPSRIGLGLGWIPNRFFRSDLTVYGIGATPRAGLLRDQNVTAGNNFTLQPRAGASYVFADYRNVRGTVFAGSYFETSRISGEASRLHATSGLEAKFWCVNFGVGIDAAPNYQNSIFSIGLDPFTLLAKMGVIPEDPPSILGGLFPNPFYYSDDGLPRPLAAVWQPEVNSIDPVDVGLRIPEKIEEKMNSNIVEGVLNSLGSIPKVISDELDDMDALEKKKKLEAEQREMARTRQELRDKRLEKKHRNLVRKKPPVISPKSAPEVP
ncbi:MAG: hypothetical protein H7222_14210 [Methylotenera sp.]|nr:hypothetical protein [Oligoflexia bacterium]